MEVTIPSNHSWRVVQTATTAISPPTMAPTSATLPAQEHGPGQVVPFE